MNKNLYSLGLMSGTSIDGIDASIIKSDGEQFIEVIDEVYLTYNRKLRSKLRKFIKLCFSRDQFYNLNKERKEIEKEITLFHAKVCKKIIKKNKKLKIDLIGFPGQTILHKPKEGYSIQIGDAQLLSKLTRTKVISNFRENDILNGGQGAPLAPLYHRAILKKISSNFPLGIINIGGISNITFIENKNKIKSFDIGPGNSLIDMWVTSKSKNKYDDNGKLAASGKLSKKILKQYLNNSYFYKKSAKSLDIKDFNLNYIKKLNLKDGCTVLSMLTVKSISIAIKNLPKIPKEIFFCGGGRKNNFIVNKIKKEIKSKIFLIDKFNFNGDFIESQAFAYLAIRSYFKKFISLPETTGTSKPTLGGKIYKN
jgi:anhydro-N-acetylmuramic acid kinase